MLFGIGNLPPSWLEGKISLIPKADQYLAQPQVYRPIILLNIDYKILTTDLLVRMLHGVLSKGINLDQTGFLKNRQFGDNIRRVVNLIDYIN